MIDFEIPTPIKRQVQFITMLGEQVMRRWRAITMSTKRNVRGIISI